MKLSFSASFHPNTLVILPHLSIATNKCDNQDCPIKEHWCLQAGWLLWTIQIMY
jgi:hypothetical protein